MSHCSVQLLRGLWAAILMVGIMPAASRAADVAADLPPSAINVRSFGAKGDGKADDTEAIQSAVNASIERYDRQNLSVRNWNHAEGYSGVGYRAHSEIVFPSGTYRITRTIVFRRYVSVRGIGGATIRMEDPKQDIFYFHANWQAHIQNLNFVGGKSQIHDWTGNSGGAQLFIRGCTFKASGDYAVRCRSYALENMDANTYSKSKLWSPYQLDWNGGHPRLTPTPPAALKVTYNSTLTTISQCHFDGGMGAIDLSGDLMVIRDSTVRPSAELDGPVFSLNGRPYLYRIQGVLHPAQGKHPYWIEHGGQMSVRDCDFQSAGPVGASLVRVNTPDIGVMNLCLVIDHCKVNAAGSPDNALVWLRKGIQPNILSITNTSDTSGRPVKAVAWEDPAALAKLETFSTSTRWEGATLPDQYFIELSGNGANIDTHLPRPLEDFRVKPVPASAMKETAVAELDWTFDDLARSATTILHAGDLGLDDNPATDDTAAVQKVLDEAGKKGNCVVVFPGRVYKLSDTLRLPANVIVLGAGVAVFEQTDSTKDAFRAKGAKRIGFKNVLVEGGRRGVDITTDPDAPARIGFANCWLSDQAVSIQCMAGDGGIELANQTELLFTDGTLAATQGVVTNAARSQIAAFWAINDPHLNNQGFIENRGGAMRVQTMLGNPTLWAGERGKAPKSVKNWAYSANTRWIDNWGRLYCQDDRFGGESGGMCNVFNRSERGTVYIGGGVTRHFNGLTKKCILYLEKAPRLAVLRNISGPPSNRGGSGRILYGPGVHPKQGTLFATGVMKPQAAAYRNAPAGK
jgi:hypothetical protein